MVRGFRYILPPHSTIEQVVAGEFSLSSNTDVTTLKHGDRWYTAQASDWELSCPEGWVCIRDPDGEFEYNGEPGADFNVEFAPHTDHACFAGIFCRNTGAWALVSESVVETIVPPEGGDAVGSISFVMALQPGDRLCVRLKNGSAGDIILCDASIKIRGS